ncbi:MAG TPA: metal ABC transporter substrate-binding protein [Bacteroidota bacterium]
MKHLIVLAAIALMSSLGYAEIRIVTSLPDLADFAKQIGGDKVKVDYIVRGDQNPHFVEVKPSYMMKLKSADLFFIIGMELELWAPQLVDGSRNEKLVVVDLSKGIQKMEVPTRLDASQGDVHRYGNPHYWLDPRNVHVIMDEMVSALAQISPTDEPTFRTNADAYLKKLDVKIAQWQQEMKPYAGSKIITFHKSWSYFANCFNLVVADEVEPKPGIPPSPSHTAELIQEVHRAGIKAIVVEPFYDLSAPEQIARTGGAKVLVLPTSEGVEAGTDDYIGLMDYDTGKLAAALK